MLNSIQKFLPAQPIMLNLYRPARLVRTFARTGILAALLLALLGSLSACGQRGPLYLPNPDAPNSSGKK